MSENEKETIGERAVDISEQGRIHGYNGGEKTNDTNAKLQIGFLYTQQTN